MTGRRSLAGNVLASITAVCAIVVTLAVVRRELLSNSPSFLPRSVRDYSPVPVEDWDILQDGGHRIGASEPVLMIVEFADFQCPGCRRFHLTAFAPLLAEHPEEVALIFRHWPLPYHTDAYAAARIAECAGAQERFAAIVDVLCHWQDSIGHAPPRFFGEAAGLPDISAFESCAFATDSIERINRDMELAQRLGGAGTPTLIINGQFLRYVPDSAGLRAIFEQAQQGEL